MARETALVVGSSVSALVTALMLHEHGVDVELVDPHFDAPQLLVNPVMGLMGGHDNFISLMLEALQAWSASAGLAGEEGIEILPWMDIATTASMYRKLKDESLLDILAGYEIVFEDGRQPWLTESVLGYKHWPEAPALPTDILESLKKRLVEAPVFVHRQPIQQIDITVPEAPVALLADGTRLTGKPLVLMCPETVMKLLPKAALPVPIRPACGHVLVWQVPQTVRDTLPDPFPCLLNRLTQGHLWVYEDAGHNIVAHYDALCDPTQARFGHQVTPVLDAALADHVQALVPALGVAGVVRQESHTITHWVTPDFLPVLGPWPGVPGLVLATGWGAQEGMFSALCGDMVRMVLGQDIHLPPSLLEAFRPNRFATGGWDKVNKPGSLDVEVLLGSAVRMEAAPTMAYMESVHQVEEPKVQHATTVHQVSKNITRQGMGGDGGEWGKSRKPKIQTAAVKN